MEDRFGLYQPPPIKEVVIERHEILPKRPYQAKPLTRHPAIDRLWRNFVTGGKAPPKKPGVIKRLLHPRNWRDYLMAEVHKDMLALAIVLTYKELFHALGMGLDSGGRSLRPAAYRPPRSLKTALDHWYKATPWKRPDVPWPKELKLEELGLKADENGRVLFPMRDDKGHIWGVQALDGLGRSAWIGETKPDLTHAIDPDGHLAKPAPPIPASSSSRTIPLMR